MCIAHTRPIWAPTMHMQGGVTMEEMSDGQHWAIRALCGPTEGQQLKAELLCMSCLCWIKDNPEDRDT